MFSMNRIYQEANLKSNEKRKELACKKLDFYFNESEKALLIEIEKQFKESAKSIMPCFLNVVSKIINLKSCVYVNDAKRTINGTESDKAIYAGFEDCANLPIVMKQANRLTNLLGVVFLRPVYRKGSMQLDLIASNLVDVALGDSPQDIEAVTITHFSENGKKDEVSYTKWTDETVTILDYNFKEVSTEENPYKCIPYVPIHASLPINDFWQDGISCDLIAIQETVNLHLSSLFHTIFYQGHATGFIKGAEQGKQENVSFGAGSMVLLPEKSEIGFVSPNSNTSNVLEALTFLIEQVAIQNGLPSSVVSSKTTEQSGISLIVENSELSELRRDQIALFARAEQELFKVFKIVWNTHNEKKISEACTLRLDFAEIEQTMTPLDKFYLFEKEYRLGLASATDYLMKRNPDYSHDEALDRLIEISAENERINNASPENTLTINSNTSLSEILNTGI